MFQRLALVDHFAAVAFEAGVVVVAPAVAVDVALVRLEALVDEAPFQPLVVVSDVAQVEQGVEDVFRRQPGLAVA